MLDRAKFDLVDGVKFDLVDGAMRVVLDGAKFGLTGKEAGA